MNLFDLHVPRGTIKMLKEISDILILNRKDDLKINRYFKIRWVVLKMKK